MATPSFKKATKEQSFLRLGVGGPAGSGKTYTALNIATEMANLKPGKIALIDTERGSASKYADIFEFDVLELADDHHPERFIEAINAAVEAGYLYIVVDSTTHEWTGKNGCLELADAATRRMKSPNSYMAWKDITPLHNRFFDSILNAKAHVIGTTRSKVDYVQEKDESTGKTKIQKVGMASIQREGADYEYDVMMDLDSDHYGSITKTRCAALDGKVFNKPGKDLAKILIDWLSSGAAPTVKEPEPVEDTEQRERIIKEMVGMALEAGMPDEKWAAEEAKFVGLSNKELQDKATAWANALERKLAEQRAKAEAAA